MFFLINLPPRCVFCDSKHFSSIWRHVHHLIDFYEQLMFGILFVLIFFLHNGLFWSGVPSTTAADLVYSLSLYEGCLLYFGNRHLVVIHTQGVKRSNIHLGQKFELNNSRLYGCSRSKHFQANVCLFSQPQRYNNTGQWILSGTQPFFASWLSRNKETQPPKTSLFTTTKRVPTHRLKQQHFLNT